MERFSHAELDWRLGLDLIELLREAEPSVAMTEPHWANVIGERTVSRLKEFGAPGDLQLTSLGDFCLARSERKQVGFIPIHPLANHELLGIAQLGEELSERAGVPIVFCCPDELERQPQAEVQRLARRAKRK